MKLPWLLEQHLDLGDGLDYRRWAYKKGASSPPPPPSPTEVSQAQAAANKEAVRESARVNQINTVTPFGNVTYTGDIGSPDRTRTETLSPDAQAAFESQQDIARYLSGFGQDFARRVTQPFEENFSLEGLPAAPMADAAERQRVEQAMFDRLQPQIDRDRDRLYTQLSGQGINFGDEAFQNAMEDQNRAVNDLRLGVTERGGAEMANLFNLGQAARQQGIAERQLERSQPLNELSAMLQGTPASPLPTFPQQAQYNVNPADPLGARQLAYQGALNEFGVRQGAQNAKFGGLAGLGGSLGGGYLAGR